MGLLRRLRRASMLIRFGAISLVLTLAVGAVLSSVLSTAITERARQQAGWTVIVSEAAAPPSTCSLPAP